MIRPNLCDYSDAYRDYDSPKHGSCGCDSK